MKDATKKNDAVYYTEVAVYYARQWQHGPKAQRASALAMFTWAIKKSWALRGVR